MTGELIKEFLVGLGFGVDDASLAKFNKAIASAAVKVTALYASVQAAAAGIFFGITKISQSFEDMGYEMRLVQPAFNKFLLLRQAMLTAYSKAGVNLQQVIRQSILFNFSLDKTRFALEAIYKSVGARFLPLLTQQLDIFRAKIFANMPKIQNALEKFVQFIFKAFEATYELGFRIWTMLSKAYDFFENLDRVTSGWSTKILAAIAIWKLLNLSFLATPLGMIITGLIAIIALYDDFKVWEAGGKSLVDWGAPWVKQLENVAAAIGVAIGLIYAWNTAMKLGGIVMAIWEGGLAGIAAVLKATSAAQWLLNIAMDANPVGVIILGLTALVGLLVTVYRHWDRIKGLWDDLKSHMPDLSGITNMLGAAGAAFNMAAPAMMTPLLPASALTNQRVSQENNVNIYGVPDAHGVARSMNSVNQQNNSDIARNMRGAAK